MDIGAQWDKPSMLGTVVFDAIKVSKAQCYANGKRQASPFIAIDNMRSCGNVSRSFQTYPSASSFPPTLQYGDSGFLLPGAIGKLGKLNLRFAFLPCPPHLTASLLCREVGSNKKFKHLLCQEVLQKTISTTSREG